MARIVIAGSRDVAAAAALYVYDMLAQVKEPTLLMRRGRSTNPGPLEGQMAMMCRVAGIPIEWHVPAPGGRDEVYYRDLDMVSKADLVLAVFSPRRSMEGGTAHVIEKAIDRRIPAYAFMFDRELERVGEFDPDNIWGGVIKG